MLSPLRHRIGIQLFSTHAVILGLTILALAWVVSVSVHSFGMYSAKINEEQIRQQAVSYFASICEKQGHEFEEYFHRISGTATMMGVQAGKVYDNLEAFAQMAEDSPELHWQPANGMFATPHNQPVLTLFWGDESLSPEVKLEIQALTQLDPLLKKARALLPDALATHIITLSGIGRYYSWSEKVQEAARDLPKVSEFDLRDGAPVTIYTREKRSTSRAQWTNIYQDDVVDGLMMTSSAAILDHEGGLRGIVGIDIPLKTIIDNILQQNGSFAKGRRQALLSFLVDADGKLIAFPREHMAFFGFAVDLDRFRNSGDQLQYNLKNSSLPEVQELAGKLIERDNLVLPLAIQGKKQLVAFQTMPTVGWKYVIVANETDLLTSVQKTQDALDGTLRSLNREFFLIAAVTALIGLLFVFLAVRYFVAPLRQLAAIAQKVGRGDLTVRSELQRRDELGTLGKAMNDMIRRLAEADAMKNEYSQQLEKNIQERTLDLELKNRQLEELVVELHAESNERQETSRALIESERQMRSIMESSLAGLCIIQDGVFKYVNPAITGMLGYSRNELLDGLGSADVVVPEYQDFVMDRLRQRTEGQYVRPVHPYNIKCRAKDGRIFDALVAGATISWEGSPAALGTIVDISKQKQVEDKLRINRKKLQASLEEKNVLLREVYHRTKNNMLVIISMLSLQMDGLEDEKARKIFIDTENRIRAMAMVHEDLCRSENLAEINLGDFLNNMGRTLIDSMTFAGRICWRTQCDHVLVSIDQAVPLGLVVNELITNSVKHGFPDGRAGEIRLLLHQQGEDLELIVADNGVGLPDSIDVHRSKSFGLQIAMNMIEKQLRGSLKVDCRKGTEYVIRFSEVANGNGGVQNVGKNIDC